jgi:hypothetical protein
MAIPDAVNIAEYLYYGKNRWRWYNQIHMYNKMLVLIFYPHVKPDHFTHANMGGKDWWLLPPEGRLHWEVRGWCVLLLMVIL